MSSVDCVAKNLNCVSATGSLTEKDCNVVTSKPETRTLPVNFCVAKIVSFALGLPQRKGVNPDHQMIIKSVKGVSCVDQLSSENVSQMS